MDELDSNFPQFLFHSDSEPVLELYLDESQSSHKEQTVIDTRHQDQEPQQQSNSDTNKRSRDDNTVFKTPLSEFRKIMKKILKSNKSCIDIMDQINKKKNSSTFIKLLVLSQHLGVKNQLKLPFKCQMQKILQKKKNKLPKKRFQELQKIYQRMKSTLECDKISDAVQQYWGRYRQKTKFEASEKQIIDFQKFLETTNIKNVKQQKSEQ